MNTQLKSIVVGALTNHWPAHLGLTTDAEKIEWLARQVEELVDESVKADAEIDSLYARLEIKPYRVDWFDRYNNQPRSMRFERWSDAQDEASRRDGSVYGPL